jgi:predicted RNase H-like HicB family nuclease
MENEYPLMVEWSKEDQQYVATCPSFPGLSALGETREQALTEAETVLHLFVESYKERQLELPEPRTVEDFSGQFRVRLPKSLHRQAAQLAESDGISLNQLMISAVEARVGARHMGIKMLAELKQAISEHASQMSLVVASALSSDEHITTTTIETNEISSRTQIVTGRRSMTKGN